MTSIHFVSSDPLISLNPPCLTEEDRSSFEAIRTIHKQMDDDNDGGIEVEESVDVSGIVSSQTCCRVHNLA